MSKAGGIAYLIKHGRAPMPSVTRTRMSGKGYAAGGTPINKSLGYGPEYDYVFVPGGMTLDASGTPQYQSGRFELRAPPPPPAAAPQDPYARSDVGGSDRGGGSDRYAGGANTFAGDPNSYTGGLLASLLGTQAPAPVTDLSTYSPAAMAEQAAKAESAARVAANAESMSNALNADTAAVNALGGQGFSGRSGDVGGYAPGSQAGAAAASGTVGGYGPGTAGFGGFGREGRDSDTGAMSRSMGGDNGGGGGDGGGGAATGGRGGDASGGGDRGTRGGWAHGGPIGMAAGGIGSLQNHGGFVGSYAKGGRMLRGPGDGLSDNIPATIGNKQPARLADGEFVVSADVVSALGGGSTEAGSKKLYAMMDRIRKAAHGTKKQVKPVKEHKVLPA